MISITKDICVHCLDKAVEVRNTGKYEVGLCSEHLELTNKEIEETLGDVRPRKKGKDLLLRP